MNKNSYFTLILTSWSLKVSTAEFLYVINNILKQNDHPAKLEETL